MKRALALGGAWALAACFPQFGSYQSDAGGGGTGGAELPATCGENGVCVEVPPGWDGPVSLRAPGEACDAAYPEPALTGKSNLSAPPATCQCTCDTPAGGGCGPAHWRPWGSPTCSADPWTTFDVPAGCTNASGGTPQAMDLSAPPSTVPGTCQPTTTKMTDAPTFDALSVCRGGGLEGACERGVCAAVPEGVAPRVCVYAPGDIAVCPGGAFTDKIVLFDGVEDTRDCSCSCGEPNASCSATVTVYTTTDCGFSAGQTDGSCVSLIFGANQFIRSLSAAVALDPGTCPPTGGPIGAVSGTGPTTVCCTPPL